MHDQKTRKRTKRFFLSFVFDSARTFEYMRVCASAYCRVSINFVVLIVLVGNILLAHLLSMRDEIKQTNERERDSNEKHTLIKTPERTGEISEKKKTSPSSPFLFYSLFR
jgi:hypothetical protein